MLGQRISIFANTTRWGRVDLTERVSSWGCETRSDVGYFTARLTVLGPERDLWVLVDHDADDTLEFYLGDLRIWNGLLTGTRLTQEALEISAEGRGQRLRDTEVWRVFCDPEIRNWLPDADIPSGFAADNNNRVYVGAGGTIARYAEGQVTYPDTGIELGASIVKLRAHALANILFGPWVVEIRDDGDTVLWTTTDSYDDDLELTVADADGLTVALRATANVTTIPTQAAAALAGAGAGNLGEGSYGYVVVFVDTHGESAISQEATLTVSDRTADGQAALTLIPLGYSGTTARRVYRTKVTPATLTAALAGLGAGALSNGVYRYAVTFISAGGESSPSDNATVTVVDAITDGQVALTAIPRGPDGTTARRIYRTDANGCVLYLAATIADNTTTTYTDNNPYSMSTTPPAVDEAHYLLTTLSDNTTTTYTDNTSDDALGAALDVAVDRDTYIRLTDVVVQTIDPATNSDIIAALLDDAGLSAYTIEPGIVEVGRATYGKETPLSALREMAALGDGVAGWLFTVYAGDGDVYAGPWSDTPTWLLERSELSQWALEYNRDDVRNAVRAELPDGRRSAWAEDATSIARWGRREITISVPQTTQAEAASLAAVYLADHAWPVRGLTLGVGSRVRKPDGTLFPAWLVRAGDVVRLRDLIPQEDTDIRVQETRADANGIALTPLGQDDRLEVLLAAQAQRLEKAAADAEAAVNQGQAISGGTSGAVASSGDMLKSVYDPDDDGVVSSADNADYATSAGNADTVDGQHAAAFEAAGTAAAAIAVHAGLPDVHHAAFTSADHTAIGNGSPHHAPVTLGTSNDGDVTLSGQELTHIARLQRDAFAFGFVMTYAGTQQTTIAFDGINTFTLAPTGATWDYYRNGIRYTITGSKTVTLSGSPPAAKGLYYIYIDATDGTLTASTGGWSLEDTKVPVATVAWDNALTPKYWVSDERHTCAIDRRYHWEHHFSDGTEVIIATSLSGLSVAPAVPVDANNTPGLSAATISDEDLKITLAALTDPEGLSADYVVFFRTAVSIWNWEASLMPFRYTAAGYIQYDSSGTMTQGQGNKFYNTYLLLTNCQGAARFAWVHGQAEFGTLAAAQNEKFQTLARTGININEFVAVFQFTWETSAAYTTKGKCRLATTPVAISIAASAGAATGGATQWGTITGTLTDQTDLAATIKLNTPASDGGIIKSGAGVLTISSATTATLKAEITAGKTLTLTAADNHNLAINASGGALVRAAATPLTAGRVALVGDGNTLADDAGLSFDTATQCLRVDSSTTTGYRVIVGGTVTSGAATGGLRVETINNIGTATQFAGISFRPQYSGTGGTLNAFYALVGLPQILAAASSTISALYAGFFRLDAETTNTAAVTTAYGVRIDTPSTNLYSVTRLNQLSIALITVAAATGRAHINIGANSAGFSGDWAIYDYTNWNSYLRANLLLGTTTDGMTAGGSLAVAGDLAHRGSKAGFYNATPITKPAITGSRGGNAALASLLTALVNLGLITDSTSA